MRHTTADENQRRGNQNQLNMGRAGKNCKYGQNQTGNHQRLRLRKELLDNVVIQAALRNRTGNNHTGRRRNHQCRQLGNQTVTNRCNRINAQYFAQAHAGLNNTNDRTCDKIYRRDDDRHDRVALDDLGCTVHCAVEVRFALDLIAAQLGFLFIDQAGRQVGVDCHLFTRHGVQGETGSNFCYAFCTLGDNDELHQNDDQEDDDADDNVALDNEFTECLDDLTCIAASRQNQARGRDIQSQTEQRCNQQQRWENRKLQRLVNIHSNQQNNQR